MDPTIFMSEMFRVCIVSGVFAFMCGWSSAQERPKAPVTDASSFAEHGISLATKGRCKEALMLLKKASEEVTKRELKYDVEMSMARCATGGRGFRVAGRLGKGDRRVSKDT